MLFCVSSLGCTIIDMVSKAQLGWCSSSCILAGLFTPINVKNMVNEIMSLIGVCLEPSVSMVMPFMTNGSLLIYLKKERSSPEMRGDENDKASYLIILFFLHISFFLFACCCCLMLFFFH